MGNQVNLDEILAGNVDDIKGGFANLDEILAGNVDDIKGGFANLDDDQLAALGKAEKGGAKRSTLLEAIDSETKTRAANAEIKFSQNDLDKVIAQTKEDTAAGLGTFTQAQMDEVTSALDKAQADLETANASIADLTADRDAKGTDLETANASIEDLRSQLAAATKETSVTKIGRSAEPRAAAPMEDGLSGDELIAALKAGTAEVVFSNGIEEITDLEPLRVAGPAWQKGAAGVVLTTPVTIKPDRRVIIAGFALLDGSGEQLAYAPMRVPTTVQAGQEMRLDRQIVFP